MTIMPTRLRYAAAALALAAGLLTVAPAQPAVAVDGRLAVTTLDFAQSHVDATTGTAAVDLNWTVTDTNPAAGTVGGTVTIRMQGTRPGTFIGRAFVLPYTFGAVCCGPVVFVGGTVRRSSYRYTFVVPRYANAGTARWLVTGITVEDGVSPPLSLTGDRLDNFGGRLTATELVDTTAPLLGTITQTSFTATPRPYAYVGGTTATVIYAFDVQDQQAGFWQGSLRVAGPGGQSVTTPFAFVDGNGGAGCGIFFGGDVHSLRCGVLVTLPAGAAAGAWTVTAVTLVDNANTTATTANPAAPTITVSSNAVITATGFTATPNPVDNWRSTAVVTVHMAVAGARQGVTSILLDTDMSCTPLDPTPVLDPDGTFAVQLRFTQASQRCTVTGIAVTDGAGDVSLYGSQYGAPDPGLTITQIPDTTAPVATAAALSLSTIASSQLGNTLVALTVQTAPSVAPVTGLSVNVYDSTGTLVASGFGGTSQAPDGSVTIFLPLSFFTPAGTYTIGFTLSDAGFLSRSYGDPGAEPVPGGPLTLTVTPG